MHNFINKTYFLRYIFWGEMCYTNAKSGFRINVNNLSKIGVDFIYIFVVKLATFVTLNALPKGGYLHQ